jgi:hypothetical protein
MKTLENIEVSEMTGEQLNSQGYCIMSYDGELCLPNNQRTKRNVNSNGELTIEGAKFFAKDVSANLQGVKDVKVIFGGSGYDVYALTD